MKHLVIDSRSLPSRHRNQLNVFSTFFSLPILVPSRRFSIFCVYIFLSLSLCSLFLLSSRHLHPDHFLEFYYPCFVFIQYLSRFPFVSLSILLSLLAFQFHFSLHFVASILVSISFSARFSIFYFTRVKMFPYAFCV